MLIGLSHLFENVLFRRHIKRNHIVGDQSISVSDFVFVVVKMPCFIVSNELAVVCKVKSTEWYSNYLCIVLPVRAILYGGNRLPFRAPRAKPAPNKTQIAPTTASPMYSGQSEPANRKKDDKIQNEISCAPL